MSDGRKFVPCDSPRHVEDGELYALRYGAGREIGRYSTIAEAVAGAERPFGRVSVSVVQYRGSWTRGEIVWEDGAR
jgi:hypothetical protein